MNDFPRQKLCEIIAQYGRDICNHPQRCEGLLRDFCGQYGKEVFLLINALKKGVATELLKSQSQIPQVIVLAKLTKRLQDELGIAEESAHWAVDSWSLALGVISQPRVKDNAQGQQQLTLERQQQAEKEQEQREEYEKKLRHSEQEVQQWKQEVDELSKALATERQRQHLNHNSKLKSFSIIISSILAALSTLVAFSIGIYSYENNQKLNNLAAENDQEIETLKNENNQKSEVSQKRIRDLNQKNDKLEGKIARLETAIEKDFERKFGQVGRGRQFYLRNKCSKPIKIAIKYKNPSGEWSVVGWWTFSPSENSYLQNNGGEKIRLNSPLFYYYAESQDSGSSIWSGEESVDFDDRTLPMQIGISFPDSGGDYTLSLSCSNL